MIFMFTFKTNWDIMAPGKYLSQRQIRELQKDLRFSSMTQNRVLKEFSDFGLTDCHDIEELWNLWRDKIHYLKLVVCKKT